MARPSRRLGDRDPLRGLVAREQAPGGGEARPAGHADDAVRLGRGVPDDLGDGVAGDRDAAEVGGE